MRLIDLMVQYFENESRDVPGSEVVKDATRIVKSIKDRLGDDDLKQRCEAIIDKLSAETEVSSTGTSTEFRKFLDLVLDWGEQSRTLPDSKTKQSRTSGFRLPLQRSRVVMEKLASRSTLATGQFGGACRGLEIWKFVAYP